MQLLPITSDAGILAVLCGVCAFFFWIERATRWRVFTYLPPLVFIYLVPVILSNSGAIPRESAVYAKVSDLVLPMMLVLMLVNIDVGRAVRVLGRGLIVMLMGSLGVIVGAVTGAALMGPWLGSDTWKAFGALTGSWVGGTANLNSVAGMFEAKDEYGLAVLADTSIIVLWLPVLLSSKRFTDRFARFSGVDPERVARMEAAAAAEEVAAAPATYKDYLALLFIAFAVTAVADTLSARLPVYPPLATASTWRILLITTIGIALSFTPLSRIPASRDLGMALVFLFMAQTGATANLSRIADQAVPFLVAALVCILIHGAFCLIAAKFLRVDVHTAAIASAANIGGVATATVVAAHHRESLIPAAILMALAGYAIGNYAGYASGVLCRWAMG